MEPTDLKAVLQDTILEIVREHSGGIKELELLVEFSNRHKTNIDMFEDVMIDLIGNERLCVLHYLWHMDKDLSRGKRFFYTT